MTRWWLSLPLSAVLLAGCNGGAAGDVTPEGAQALRPAVQHVREVAALGDYYSLRAAVAQLKSIVRQQEREGNVTASRSAAILDAADVLLADARTELSPTPTPSPTLTTESPSPEPTTESPSPEPTTESPSPEPTTESPSPDVEVSVDDKPRGNNSSRSRLRPSPTTGG